VRREVLRARMMTAAADLFRARGYRATTLDELARTLGMSKATLYGYFRSKEDLLAAIFHRTMTLFEEGIREIRRSGTPPAEQLRRVIRHHVRAVVAERSFLTVFFGEEDNLPRRLASRIGRRKAGYDRQVQAIVEAGVRDGTIEAPRPRLLVFALLGMTNWVYRWYHPRGAWDADTVAAALTTLLEEGYRLTPTRRRLTALHRLDAIARDLHHLRPLLATPPRRLTRRSSRRPRRAGRSRKSTLRHGGG
jgi:AcrR family transcriptional regulator